MPDRGTILIVDDEQLVLDVGCAILKQLGYPFLTALDGQSALDIVASHRQELCCIILDYAMPGMDGRECLKALRRIAPELKVLLSSGYKEEQAAAMFLPDEKPDAFIQKPFLVDGLSRKIDQLIG
jgi:CheY-like chemotaxis protein